MDLTRCVPVRDKYYRAPLKTIEIPKTISHPDADDRLSFLTALPAEMRNEVYKWLFARDDPIIYTGPGRRNTEPEFVPDFDENEEEIPPFTPEEGVVLRRPSHDLGPSVAMLRACRQIFHEAVGVLYSGNKIIVSASLNKHNEYMEQFGLARQFLFSIGTQVAHVKEIKIDISPLCLEDDCDRVVGLRLEEQIDVLPLARLIWYPPSSTCGFHLVHTGRSLDHRVHWDWPGKQAHVSKLDAQLLEDIVQALSKNNTLRKHGRFERLIDKIELSLDLEIGYLHYPITGPYYDVDKRVIKPFEILMDDKGRLRSLTRSSWAHTSDLHPLPPRLHRKIMRWAMEGEKDIVFDLDCRNVSGLPLNILQVDRSMRSLAHKHLSFYNQITIMMTTSRQKSDFDQWRSLKAWLEESISDSFPTDKEEAPSHTEPSATLVLKANLATPATLPGLRIEIASFIRLTYTLNPYILLRFELPSTGKDGLEECQNHVTTLLLLRKRLFVFISSIMEN
jgi:hypothetical protein